MTIIEVTSTTLFHLAARLYGDARLWRRIAAANGLSDPMVVGLTQLVIPAGASGDERS